MSKKQKKEWFDDETFWQEMYPYTFPEESFNRTLPRIEKMLTLAKPAGKSALDLCCGPGRYLIALAKAGFNVTGVDKSKFLLDKARDRAKADKVDVELLQSDMRDFTQADAFDIIINMGVSFGYFKDKQEDLLVLGNILTSLKPGGVCMIDVVGKERIAKTLPLTTFEVLPDGAKLIEHHEVFDDWTRTRSEWILIRKNRAKTYKFDRTIYSGQELRDLMQHAGFTDVRLYGNLDGAEYGPEASQLIAIGYRAP
ncbi:MAG: methyltransferase domain-containing protein [Geobacteraceae bacterium]|nr:methyltransferase domain-containing protein [Geobacteraceae bacterium]